MRPPATVKAIAASSRPRDGTTRPTAPLTIAGRASGANGARRARISRATAVAPATGGRAGRPAPRSARKTTSGPRTSTSASTTGLTWDGEAPAADARPGAHALRPARGPERPAQHLGPGLGERDGGAESCRGGRLRGRAHRRLDSRLHALGAAVTTTLRSMAAPVAKDQELELRVDSLAYGGNGGARLKGFVVFVRRGLPGDPVRARGTKVKGKHADALATEVLEPSPERVDAPCSHYPACGGCRFQDLAYEAQAAAKEAQVADALRRLGRIAEPPLEPILPAVERFHYRNKLEYSFAPGPEGPIVGFHKAGRWDEVLDIERCWLTTDLGNAIREAVRAWAIEEELLGLRFRVRPNAFLQTNTAMAERLYELALEAAALTGRETVYDLYCGIGTIGLVMAAHALTVWGVEVSEESVACALENAELNGVVNAAFFAGNVGQALEELRDRAGPPDVVVVDPPRAGLAGKALRRVGEAGAPRLVYVSCNPTTLAGDAKRLAAEYGYRLERARPVDMFPHTPHVETVALLTRS